MRRIKIADKTGQNGAQRFANITAVPGRYAPDMQIGRAGPKQLIHNWEPSAQAPPLFQFQPPSLFQPPFNTGPIIDKRKYEIRLVGVIGINGCLFCIGFCRVRGRVLRYTT